LSMPGERVELAAAVGSEVGWDCRQKGPVRDRVGGRKLQKVVR
jgi:hypothetical protein